MTIREQWTHKGNNAGSYTSKLDKGTAHSTEGDSIEGAIAAFTEHNSWPHKTVDYRTGHRRVCVHNALTVAARALKNTSAAGETNRDGTLQYEFVGHAATILDEYGEQDWFDLGHDVIGPDFRVCGIPLVCTVTMPTYPPPNGEQLGHESTRLSRAAVTAVVGLLGHCNWPENEHGDPGPLTAKHYRGGTVSAVDLILEGAGVSAVVGPPPYRGRVMREGDKGQDVAEFKVMLWSLGYRGFAMAGDGVRTYTKGTKWAVARLQRRNGLRPATGDAGPRTVEKVRQKVIAKRTKR